MSYDLGDDCYLDDDADDLPLKFIPGQQVESNKAFKRTPIFAYDYLSLDSSKFCFNNPNLAAIDFIKYFEQVKDFSGYSINYLLDLSNRDDRFHSLNPNRKDNLREEITRLFPDDEIDFRIFPAIIQFALYTNSRTGVDQNGIPFYLGNSPRVVCLIGNNGVFHVLFLDYEHEFTKMPPQAPAGNQN